MKKIALTTLLGLILACGSSEKKKEKFEYKRVQVETKADSKNTSTTPIDMDNPGIGPIQNFEFPESIDQSLVSRGAATFKQKCTACHQPNARLIGPAMTGIYERRNPAWVLNIMLNPTQILKEDPIGKALLQEYNNVLMLNQNLSQEEARALAEYFRTL